MRPFVIVVLVLIAFLAGYRFASKRAIEADYELLDGQLVKIDPDGTKTRVGPPILGPRPEDKHEAAPSTVPAPALRETEKVLAPTPKAAAPAVPTRHYRTYDNRDLDGGDIDTLRNVDLQNCNSACMRTADCRAYSFDKWNRYCFLKVNVGTLRLDPRSITGIRDDVSDPPAATSAVVMERYRGKAFPGLGYKTVGAAQLETCEMLCRNEDVCVAYTFQTNDRLCRLFDTTGEYFPNNLAESGGKRQ